MIAPVRAWFRVGWVRRPQRWSCGRRGL